MQLRDLRRPPADLNVPTGANLTVPAQIVLTVGSDCAIGKMTVSLELERAARARGVQARFVPTGNNWDNGWGGGNNGNWGGGGNNWNRPEVVCESRNFRQSQCNWRNNWGFPQLVQQISQVRCVRDRNWGYNRNRAVIWVTDGCAARFRGR